jgi:hypothetical protein
MSLSLLFFFIFFGLAGIICYQDFKAREISLWLLILYSLTCLASTWLLQGTWALLANAMSTLLYFGLIFAVILLYYFLKEKKFSNPIDSKIGLADVILFLVIGFTLQTVHLILFFSGVFLVSALLGLLWFNKKEQTVPLAGILCLPHALSYLIFLWP